MARPGAILFDLDGTLIDASPDLARAINQLRAERDLPSLTQDEVVAQIGNGARNLVRCTLPELTEPNGALDEEALGDLHQRFLAIYSDVCLVDTHPYPGIMEMLAALRSAAPDVPLAVLTNKPEAMTKQITAHLGMDPHLAAIIGSDTLPTRKPDPTGLHTLAERFGTTAANTILVGDSLVDAQTAINANARLILVRWGFESEPLESVPSEAIVDDVPRLHQLLLGHLGSPAPTL